jgi:hypothetical protein
MNSAAALTRIPRPPADRLVALDLKGASQRQIVRDRICANVPLAELVGGAVIMRLQFASHRGTRHGWGVACWTVAPSTLRRSTRDVVPVHPLTQILRCHCQELRFTKCKAQRN